MSKAPLSSPHAITIVAHRGIHDFFPENSIGAFEVAREAGFDWIEFDVWSSADGVPVIMHDETLDRTSEGTGLIAEKTSLELSRINLRGSSRDGSEKVPVGLPAEAAAMLIEVKPPSTLRPCNSPCHNKNCRRASPDDW